MILFLVVIYLGRRQNVLRIIRGAYNKDEIQNKPLISREFYSYGILVPWNVGVKLVALFAVYEQFNSACASVRALVAVFVLQDFAAAERAHVHVIHEFFQGVLFGLPFNYAF